MLLLQLATVVATGVMIVVSGTSDREQLFETLFRAYNQNVIPVQDSGITVYWQLSLIQASYDEGEDRLTTNVYKRILWKDYRLTWDPENFGGVDTLRVPSSLVWKPDIKLYNSLNPKEEVDDGVNVLVYSDGSVLHIPPARLQTSCQAFDHVIDCPLTFGSWSYHGDLINLDKYEGAGVDTLDYMQTVSLRLLNTSMAVDMKYYPCCLEPYPSINVQLSFNKTKQD